MTHVSDFTKSNDQIVLDLVNANLVPGTPELTTGQVDMALVTTDGSKATALRLSSKTGSGYRGTVDVTYNRVTLSDVPNIEETVHTTEENTISGILAEVNIRYGINLTAEDITIDGQTLEEVGDLPLNPINHNAVVLSVAAKNTSLVWTGVMSLTYKPLIVELQHAVGITMLDGLYAPMPLPDSEDSEWDGTVSQITYAPQSRYPGSKVGMSVHVGEDEKWMIYSRYVKVEGIDRPQVVYARRNGMDWTEVSAINLHDFIDPESTYTFFGKNTGVNANGTIVTCVINENENPRIYFFERDEATDVWSFNGAKGPDIGPFHDESRVEYAFDDVNRFVFYSVDGYLLYCSYATDSAGSYTIYSTDDSGGCYPIALGNGKTGIVSGRSGFTILTFVEEGPDKVLAYVDANGATQVVDQWYDFQPVSTIDYGDSEEILSNMVAGGWTVRTARGNRIGVMMSFINSIETEHGLAVFDIVGNNVVLRGSFDSIPLNQFGQKHIVNFGFSPDFHFCAVTYAEFDNGPGACVISFDMTKFHQAVYEGPTSIDYVSPWAKDVGKIGSFQIGLALTNRRIFVGDPSSFVGFSRDSITDIGLANEALRLTHENAGAIEFTGYNLQPN